MLTWFTRWRRLRANGVLGMNARNTRCILDLNPRHRYPLVDGKKAMRDLCRDIGVPTPRLYAVLAAHSALRHLPRLLEARTDFVVKPDRGAAGRGVLVVIGRDGDGFLRHNGEHLSRNAVRQHISSVLSGLYSLGGVRDAALIQQRVVSDPALAGISYQGTADVRVILYKNDPAMAMLRLPTRQSGGRANLHQGAIGAGVGLRTGLTVRAVVRNRVTTHHPDTGVPLVGFRVPHWERIIDMSRKVSAAVGLGYVGVDIVLDETEGPLLLEANARPGLAIQIANGWGLAARLRELDAARAQGASRRFAEAS
jgi:alpha-L-glutamate ligase-like protein